MQVDVLESWVRAIELPDHIPSHARDLVDRTHMSSRDQVVAVGILVDRIDVEEVPRRVSCHTISACVGAIDACIREARGNVVEGAPFEQ